MIFSMRFSSPHQGNVIKLSSVRSILFIVKMQSNYQAPQEPPVLLGDPCGVYMILVLFSINRLPLCGLTS